MNHLSIFVKILLQKCQNKKELFPVLKLFSFLSTSKIIFISRLKVWFVVVTLIIKIFLNIEKLYEVYEAYSDFTIRN